MKRFIRTQDGKIIDTYNFDKCYIGIHERAKYDLPENIPNAIKQADTIEKLIEVGDLTEYGFVMLVTNVFILIGIDKLKNRDYVNNDWITELYTKQGRNYVLVAEKIDGEWRVI